MATTESDYTAPTDADKRTPGFGIHLHQISQAGILIVGGLYTVGLLIVNINLGQYGLFHVELARPEYILVGALWAFLMIFTIAALRCIVALRSGICSVSTKGVAALITIFACISVAVMYFSVLKFLSGGTVYVIERSDWSINWTGVFVAVIFAVQWVAVSNIRQHLLGNY